MNTLLLVASYIVLTNFVSFVLYGIDKWRARKGIYRISERMLLLVALCGGSLGALLGMSIFRHKTRHWRFVVLVPLFLLAHLYILYLLFL